MRVTGLVHPAGDRLGHHVARREVGELVDALHEAVALEVDEERALAADRLGDQRLLAAGVGAEVHHGGVELHELEVADRGAGTQRDRRTVPGRDRGVGGLREDLPEPAAGQHDRAAVHGADAVVLALAHHVQGEPGDRAVRVEQQVDGQRVLDDLDLGCGLDGRVEGPLDLRARGVAAGVGDAVAVVAALAGQADLAGGVVVEVGAEGDQLAYGGGAVGDQDAHGLLVARARAGHEGVALVLLGGVAGAECGGDAALRPLRRAGVEHVLGDDEDAADPVLEPERRGQAGDAGPDDHDVDGGRPARGGGQQSAGKHVGEASGDG